MNPQISVIVATRNRAGYLRKAIVSLIRQSLDSKEYEIIVVDNGSQDETKLVIEEFSSADNLHYIFEPVMGLSRARNTGWRNAQGEYIVFMDDDAIADRECLKGYFEFFHEFGHNIGLVGGKVELIWESPRPVWLPSESLGIFSAYHYGNEPIALNKDQWLSACNLAIPKKILSVVNGFREDLGRTGNLLLAGGEIYLRYQIDELGLKVFYHPNIIVHHHVSSNKLTKKWFRNAAFSQGQSEARMLKPLNKSLPFGKRIKLSLSKTFWMVPRFGLMLLAVNPARRFRRMLQVIETTGFIFSIVSK